VLRAIVFIVLAVVLRRELRAHVGPLTTGERRVATTSAELATQLRALASSPAVDAMDVELHSFPSALQRDWLRAARGAGVIVRWHGALPTTSIEATSVREPEPRTRLLVATDGHPLAISDSIGLIDSVRSETGASVEGADLVGELRAARAEFVARTPLPHAAARRAVLVLGRADWESKFVATALTERGWSVRARIPASPQVTVRDDALLPLDTSRYDVVIALDSTAADLAPTIARFVASGGGLIVSAAALASPGLRALAPAAGGQRRPGRILLTDDTVSRGDLPLRPLGALRDDAVVLERVTSDVAVAARRAGAGRVIAIGYDESWRWRMLGGDGGAAQHSAWWSQLAGQVSPDRDTLRAGADAAPLAALVQALGPSSAAIGEPAAEPMSERLPLLLLVLLVVSALAETASRRFRGDR
jgi:hypothetical protein